MKFKNSAFCVLDGLIKDNFLLFTAVFTAVLFTPVKFSANLFYTFFLSLFPPLFRLYRYFTTEFELKNDILTIKNGFFFKRKTRIPINSFSTVDLSRSLIFKIVKRYRVKIDDLSKTKAKKQKPEAVFVLSEEQKDRFLAIFQESMSKKSLDSSPEIFRVKSSSLLLFGILKTNFLLFFTVFPIVFSRIVLFISAINSRLYDRSLLSVLTYKLGRPASIAALILFFILLFYFISSFLTLSLLYNFKLTLLNGEIFLSYGLFNRRNYRIKKENIHAVSINQSFIMRLLRLASIDGHIIGFGDESDKYHKKNPILFPLLRLKDAGEILKLFTSENYPFGFSKKSEKSLFYTFFSPSFIVCLLLFIFSFFLNSNIIKLFFLILLLFSVIKKVLVYLSSDMKIGGNFSFFSNGALKKKTVIFKTQSIEAVILSGGQKKLKRGFCNLKIFIFGPKQKRNKVLNISAKNHFLLKTILNRPCMK